MTRTRAIIVMLFLAATLVHAESNGAMFFFRLSDRIDRFLLQKVDTNYIALPEYSWRVAFTSGMLGVYSSLNSMTMYEEYDYLLKISMYNHTAPSVDLGFYAGYRGLGFGYSWDVLNAYARRFNISLGAKTIGVDFSHQTSTNINTQLAVENAIIPSLTVDHIVTITNTNLKFWYALNSAHYSHQATVKQTYIQRKTAGSLLLHLSYMASQIAFKDTMMIEVAQRPIFSALMSDMTSMTTRQVAVGIGYGINYTPNKGKVVLHASAAAMLVCYSINDISYYMTDSVKTTLPGEPMYLLHSSKPVHVTGNVRAGISWEINKWVHLSAWATGDNIRFHSEKTHYENELFLSNWNWQAHLNVGVRLGVSKQRKRLVLKEDPKLPDLPARTTNLPQWLTDYFFSPSL